LGCLAFRDITETNRLQLVLYDMQNRTIGPYLAAIHRILNPSSAFPFVSIVCSTCLALWTAFRLTPETVHLRPCDPKLSTPTLNPVIGVTARRRATATGLDLRRAAPGKMQLDGPSLAPRLSAAAPSLPSQVGPESNGQLLCVTQTMAPWLSRGWEERNPRRQSAQPEANRMQLVLFCTQNCTADPCLVAGPGRRDS
jgi:hypothetical protein